MISVIIPHCPLSEQHNEALRKCTSSLQGADEVIVIVNEIGFGPAMNLGISLAKGDYLALVNNDCYMQPGWNLEELCVPGTVTHPLVNGIVHEFDGAFLVIPRSIIDNELGGQVYDEIFKVGYWEDVDLWVRLKEANVPIEQKHVHVSHPEPGSTMRHMDKNQDNINKQVFIQKHGTLPIKNW